jgi:hypothetical protein
MDKGKELLFILVANFGKYFFINPLVMRGKTRDITSNKIISNIGIENSVL